MRSIPSNHSVRVIAFEAQGRFSDDSPWLTLRVARRWSAIEDATEQALDVVDPSGRRITATRVVTVDHSSSVDFRSAL